MQVLNTVNSQPLCQPLAKQLNQSSRHDNSEKKSRLLGRVIKKFFALFARSKQRRQLAQLSDQLLKDIGLERTAALKESRKWFWQA